MNLRAPLLLALCAPLVSACFQKLDDQASREFDPNPTAAVEAPDGGGSGAPFPVNVTTPEIGKAADENGDVTTAAANACDKVQQDAHDIRQRVCSGCHEGSSAQGAPLTFILDDGMLINAKSTSSNNVGKTYVIPGDPDNSLLYRRAAIVQDMPPGSTDIRNASTSLSISDFSVLREWILNCTGAPSQTAATGTGGATGATSTTGSTGTGGATGDTSTTGTGGATGTGAGGATAEADGGAGAGGNGGGDGGFRRDGARG